jgi:hypothetical protein
MHEEHWEAAEKHDPHEKAAAQHDLAAQAHRTASEHNEKGDDGKGQWHAERALEHSTQAFRLSKEAHTKSDRIEQL